MNYPLAIPIVVIHIIFSVCRSVGPRIKYGDS